MGHNTFGDWSRNLFKNISDDAVKMVFEEIYVKSAVVYSAIISSTLSGWYKNGY